jgi:ABC-type uncharacterized transport system involved in gliding motility auxiliary subunit
MKQRNIEALFYSTVGVAAMFAVLIAFYAIASQFKVRADLTADKAYTLSAGTRHILSKLDSPVTLRYYCTQAEMPPELKPYAQEIEDLLTEYQQAGKGKIILKRFDPKPDSDAEDSARLDGIQGEPLNGMGGDNIYLGLAVSQLDQKQTIPTWLDLLRDPSRERLLEYEISRAISRVLNPEPPVIGIISALPVFGDMPNPMLRMNRQTQEPAIFVTELKKAYNVVDVPLTSAKIDDNIKLLIVDHPRGISDTGQYAIDQFIMRGGKVIAFLDPSAYFDPVHDQMEQLLGRPSNGQSSLPKLLKAWGLDMDSTRVVADANASMRNPSGAPMPGVLLVTRKGINQDDIVTSQIDNLCFPFAGAFTGKPADGLTETILAQSSTNAELVEGIIAGMNGNDVLKDFKATGIRYAVAVRLTGKFKTAFPEGKPGETPPSPDESPDEPPKPAASVTDTNQLKESATNTTVILVADTDFLADPVAFTVGNLGGYRFAQPNYGNINLLLNAVDQLAGDNDLIAIRSRGGLNRPFTRLQELEDRASQKGEEELKKLQALQNETQQKINALQANKPGGIQRFIPSPEQEAELKKYEKTAADYRKQLHEVEKNLAKDTDSLKTKIRIYNIGAMPALVALTGIVLSLVKHKRTAAK